MKQFRIFSIIILVLIISFSHSGLADIKDSYTDSTTIAAAMTKAKQENKKVLVYFTISRDFAAHYDFDRLLFTYPDFIEIKKEYVMVRDWATTQYAKSKSTKNFTQIVGQPRVLYFAALDPNDETSIKHIELKTSQTSPFNTEDAVVRELIRYAKGDKSAEKYKPTPTKVPKLNELLAKYTEAVGVIDAMSKEQVDTRITEMDALLPDAVLTGILRNYYNRKTGEQLRINSCIIKQKAVSKVVICFDEYTYLTEIGKWSRKVFYPVLYWHPYLTENFIRAYKPAEIEVIPRETRKKADVSMIYAAILASFSSESMEDLKNSSVEDLKKLYTEKNHKPRGVVLLNMKSPEYLGGVALAAGRSQWVEMFDSGSNPQTRTDPAGVEKIRTNLMNQLDKSGFAYKGWDDIDYITMAANIPFNYDYGIAANGGNYVTDDAIARLDNDLRYAYVGRLMYGAGVATYQAMCSLFLKPEKTLYFSSYSDSGIWKTYWPDQVEEKLKAETVYHPQATIAKFVDIMRQGNKYNFIYINSSGGSRNWSTSSGGGTHNHIPFSVPCSVHMTHSGTFGSPFDVDSIAVRWILGGAFCYLGSHSEPYLDAFVMPNRSITQALNGLPLGETFRWSAPNSRWRPWKLAFTGDPMYSITGSKPSRQKPDKIDKKHTVASVFKDFYKDMKRTKEPDRATVFSQTLALALIQNKISEIKKTLKLIYKYQLKDEDINQLLTEILGFFLHNIDEKYFDLFELVKMPEKFDKMNNWMFDRIFMRLHPYLAAQKSTVATNFIKLLSVLLIPDIQLDYITRMLKSLVEDTEYQKKTTNTKDQLVTVFLSAMKKGSKLYENASKMLEK